MVEVELAGGRMVAVALLGDGERHDPCRRGGEAGEEQLWLLGCEQRLAEHSDHARLLVRAVALDQRVEIVLRAERLAHGGTAQARPADAPRSGHICERPLGEDGLMRAVKRAQSQVSDADVGVERRRWRANYAVSGRAQGALRKAIHPECASIS